MSVVTFLADDKSPLIHYDSGWSYGNSAHDPLADQYFRGTSQASNVTGGTAKFSFNGTAFWIYGAKRTDHGTFTVTVDGASFSDINGESSVDLFQQVLFNQTGLSQGLHTVSLTNTGSGSTYYVDIDMVVWETEIDGEQLATQMIDDANPAFQYQEPAWSTNPTYSNLYGNGTRHSTSTYNASATLTFTAESVSIFGSVGPNSGPYSVSIDSGPPTTYNATSYLAFYEVMLYHADNLGSGQHQLTLTNLPDSSGQTLNIDYAVLLTSSSSSSNSSGATSSSGSTPSSGSTSSSSDNAVSTGLGSGAIAGIVVAATVAVLTLGASFFFYRRWKSTQAALQDLYRIHTSQHLSVNARMGASSSVETRSNVNLVRNESSSQGATWRSYQQPHNDYQTVQRGGGRRVPSSIDSCMLTVDEAMRLPIQSPVDESGSTRRLLPDAPGTERNIFQQQVPTDSLSISQPSPVRHRASMQSTSATMSDIPPDYTQAIRQVTR